MRGSLLPAGRAPAQADDGQHEQGDARSRQPSDGRAAAAAPVFGPAAVDIRLRIRFGLFAVLSRLGAVNDWAALERRFFEESR